MVATWSIAASSTYYAKHGAYYLGGNEPSGRWYAPAGDLGLVDGSEVDANLFERLFEALDAYGKSMLSTKGGKLQRSSAFDITFSAPRSVSLAWGLASNETKRLIEAAQERAVRSALSVVEQEATFARRGKNGTTIEKVALNVAIFQHGESRPAKHEDGRVFGDCNLHHHAVCLSLSTRADKTVGGLHSVVLRNAKMLAGAVYHAALAYELQTKLGFSIDRVGRNGIFEIEGVDENIIRYFSARRAEIEDELNELGVTSSGAVALAAAVAKSTRSNKSDHEITKREEIWAEAARGIGIEVETFTEGLRDQTRLFDRDAAELLLRERLAVFPSALTERESVIDRKELLRSAAEALVGTGLPAELATTEAERLLRDGTFVEIGRDPLLLPIYSTPEMLAIEHDIVVKAQALACRSGWALDRNALTARCQAFGLSSEQTAAALAATDASAVAIIEGAPGAGKTTTLAPIIEAYRQEGCRVIGAATAWRVAISMEKNFGIESRAIASWIHMLKSGTLVLDNRTVLIVDEAALLSSRDMHALLQAVSTAGGRSSADIDRPLGEARPLNGTFLGCKILLVGDRKQMQPISAGAGLDLVSRAVEACRVETIVRQFEPWARKAIADFGSGRAAQALQAFAEHDLVVEAKGQKAAVLAVVDRANQLSALHVDQSCLILAKTNAQVAAISREVRARRRTAGLIFGEEFTVAAATPSGQPTELTLAAGDKIRFLARNVALGTINGTIANVTRVVVRQNRLGENVGIRVEADIQGRKISFDPAELADAKSRARIGWAYASTIAGSQGSTVDHAVVLLDPSLNRHETYVATSRARSTTTLVVDTKSIDRRLIAEISIDRQSDSITFTHEERRDWLAGQLSRASPKISTLDVIQAPQSRTLIATVALQRESAREFSHGL
jgi:conjugative relaxase-like TrwC/TraI family protein